MSDQQQLQFRVGDKVEVATPDGQWPKGKIAEVDPTLEYPYRVRVLPTDEDPEYVTGWLNSEAVRVRQNSATNLAEEVRRLSAEVQRVSTDLERTDAMLRRERAAHEQFKALVRETAIEVARDNKWCLPGLNEVLEGLGLEPAARQVTIEFEIKTSQRAVVTIETDKADEDIDADWIAENIRWGDPEWDQAVENEHWDDADIQIENITVEEDQ